MNERTPTPDALRSATKGGQRVVLVTGMSGAGKSTALGALEDIGYEAVDNLPLALLDGLIASGRDYPRPLAIGVDVRTRDFGAAPFIDVVDGFIDDSGIDLRLLFLDCDDEVLERRYSRTRRRHPLGAELPLADGIRTERRRLARLRGRADPVIDTTDLAESELRTLVQDRFRPDAQPGMAITVTSFAFGHGLPRQADLVFDVRFLKNPHYQEDLRPLSGADEAVAEFIHGDADFAPFFERLTEMLALLLPRYQGEGKSYLTIAVGCTGGRHRSVYVVEQLFDWLTGQGFRAALRHRELGLVRTFGA